jgi:hypothetical protein
LLNSHERTAPAKRQRSHEASEPQTHSQTTKGHRCD